MKESIFLRKTITKLAIIKKSQEKIAKLQKVQLKKRQTKMEKIELPSKKIVKETIEEETKPEVQHEFVRDPAAYLEIPEIPTYEATLEEFNDPMNLFQKLNKMGYAQFGCVKIKPPKTWNPEFSFNPKNKKMNTREQILRHLNEGKPFDQNPNAYTTEEFQQFADNFAKNYNYKAPFDFEDIHRTNEYEYWALVEDPLFQKEDVVVEYAADLPSFKYGSGFPTVHGGRMTDDLDLHDMKTHPFNLNNLSRAKDSLFQIITKKQESISGISSPWMYSGMLFASFCWHVEDLYMYSINYMHKGAPKTWYCIPGDFKDAFDDVIKEKFGLLFIKNPSLLYNIVLTMNPLELMKRNIPVYRTEQKAGEFILTFPKVYHAGFSHGFNISEAVNLAVPEWIPEGFQATQDYARDSSFKKCTFPYEWILLENARKINELNFTKEARDEVLKEYGKMKDLELSKRETVKAVYDRIVEKQFDNPNLRYDHHTCGTCSNYTYLSFLSCTTCKKSGCTHHVTICNCLNAKMVLNVRLTDKELIEAPESSMQIEEESD